MTAQRGEPAQGQDERVETAGVDPWCSVCAEVGGPHGVPHVDDQPADGGIPYMLDNTPEEFDRVRAVAAERHRQEADQIAQGQAPVVECPLSQRVDGLLHSWRFDGDDPYVVCSYCDQMQDALTGRVIRQGRTS